MEGHDRKMLLAGLVLGLAIGFLAGRAVYVGAGTAPVAAAAVPTMSGPPPAPQGGGAEAKAAAEAMHREIDTLLKKVQSDPNDRAARVALGNITYDNQMFDMAVKYYEEALRLDGNDPNVLTDLGVAYRNTGNPAKAVEMFEKAVAVDPSHAPGWFNIAVVAFGDLKQVEKARGAIAKVLEIKADFPGARELEAQIKIGNAT